MYKTSSKCKVCTSAYRAEIEEMKYKHHKTYETIEQYLLDEYGFRVSTGAIHRHFQNHFDYTSDALEEVSKRSKYLFTEKLMDAGTRAAKISAMLEVAYNYIKEHYSEMELDTAVRIFFSGTDALNKMEGLGVFDGNDFMTKFLQILHEVKQPEPQQAELIFEANMSGEAAQIEPIQCQTTSQK